MSPAVQERQPQIANKSERRLGSRTRAKETAKWVKPTVWGSIGGVVLIIIVSVVAAKVAGSRAASRHRVVVKDGCAATLALAEKLKPVAQEYLDFRKAQPKKSWQPRQLEAGALGLPADLPVHDVLVLCGTTLVASVSGTPKQMGGKAEGSPEPRVDVHNGPYTSSAGVAVVCLQFRTTLDLPTGGERLTAHLIVRNEE